MGPILQCVRWRPAWAVLTLVAWLAGCGPGVGGTGTGAAIVPPAAAGPLTLLPLCDSDAAPLLRCTGAAGTTTAALGSGLVWLADGSAARNALARVEGNAIDFDVACAGLQFSGSWGQLVGQAPRFHGLVRRNGREPQTASLSAQRVGTGLVLQLFDAGGVALTAPIPLQVVAAPPPAGACS